jgi:hypothetical protein
VKLQLRKSLLNLVIIQVIIAALSLVIYRKISLLCYINISFYITMALLLSSLLIYTIHSGFFDTIAKSFNRMATKRDWDDIPSLSELMALNQKPFFLYGFVTGLIMLIALVAYYH